MRNGFVSALLFSLSFTLVGDDALAGVSASSSGKVRFADLIARHARANGVSLDLAHAVVSIESRYNAGARGRAGEIGLMQIKLRTARGVGYKGSAKGLYDPDTNLRYGMKYLGKAQKLAGGDLCRTIMKYNGGHGMKRPTRGTSRYCGKARELMAIN
jgi:soluble lytic murein transglycosylase-like protein